MNNLEFLSYREYERDQNDPKLKYNPYASATVRLDRRFVLTYILNSFGDNEPFWQEISAGVGEVGKDKKTYLKGCMLDSNYEKEQLLAFIKESVEKHKANCRAVTQEVSAIGQNVGGVAIDDQLPF
jgi:hypothetical protein